MEQNFNNTKNNLRQKIDELYKSQDYFRVIDLLESCELDYELCLELVRTYINAANRTSDPESLFEKAMTILSKTAVEGRNCPKWNFYTGYILFKRGLYPDSKLRFEHAIKYTGIDDGSLLNKLDAMLSNVNALIAASDYTSLSDEKRNALVVSLEKNFGKLTRLCSLSGIKGIEVYTASPTEEHPYYVLVSIGLCSKYYKKDTALSPFEVVMCLPEDYRFTQNIRTSFEVYLYLEVLRYLATETNPVEFGYYLEKEGGFSKSTAFSGVMLTGLGDYDKKSQQADLDDGVRVRLYEMLPLRPMELNFRKNHSALELLEKFKEKLIKLTPFISTRDDALRIVEVK
ncbi:MAG: suppressor of fused domain protein [Succinivibrio sp.]